MTEILAGRLSQPARRAPGIRGRGGWLRNTGVIIALAVLALILTAALAPQLITTADPDAVAPAEAFQSPSAAHFFGTDESGRDVYTRVVFGAGNSLLIGIAATAVGLGLALILGLLGGLGSRLGDFVSTRLVEVMFALPGLLLALVFIAIAGPGVVTSTVAVGLSTAPGYARIIRSQLRSVRSASYVEAATVLGHSRARIVWQHILPGALSPIFVLGTLGVGQAIVWASSLGFLGLGVAPPAAEWGAMLSSGRTYIDVAWWLTVFPGLAIVATAASFTVLGRALNARTRQEARG
ncbi:ABC transporter permease [Salinibacterium sp. NSLL150]|uniref:ABC transporter permease n=1 Tax=unclassified Salinibacterium TaxID=2632331 RepID=UPI0018CD5F54|nr:MULTISPECIES: ABC transporter permease [unclassified Salinibacterium]MBH0098843.1 ABC transporter permease [Salinibacterium sp. NSLL35]MBH0101598.1 ABC transporter permease [Salinibacterium sp. NSLL150]MBH0104357.1 ABC transporter permease [Salinibacterium sp. NSLL16]MBH0107118.1 ABC transporter permease [Salinibacterium sp. NSLL17]